MTEKFDTAAIKDFLRQRFGDVQFAPCGLSGKILFRMPILPPSIRQEWARRLRWLMELSPEVS
ncbi:MAG: hypothetical protein IT330_19620 [Anaerolineae bacterium]|nr:hypothetical protein [Anaerolineae bacterium]